MDDSGTDFHTEPRPARLSSERIDFERRKTAEEARGSISTGRWMWEWTKAISTAIVLFLVIRTFLFEAFKIPTGSMEGTLLVGDFLLVNKVVYGAELPITHQRLPAFSHPRRGEVVVFLPPHDPHRNYVKRIVGVGGDTLQMKDKVLYRNGELQVEPYVRHVDPLTDPPDERMLWQLDHLAERPREWGAYHPTRDNWGPIVIPAGKLFVLGDNRDNSEDSRWWGLLTPEAVKGRPMFVYYSFNRDIAEPFSWITSVRWDRIGDIIR